MKNADMPAMPVVTVQRIGNVEKSTSEATGLTKREMMAMHIMAGIASGNSIMVTCSMGIGYAVSLADQLIAELDRTSK